MSNKTIWTIVIVVLVLIGIYVFVSAPSSDNLSSENSSQENQEQEAAAKGRVVFSVTDAAADMSAISEINMKVNSVDMHNSTNGWVTVSTTPRTYSLLKLNASNESEILADIQAKAGTYDQVRLMIDSISVKTKAGATFEAKLPSNELKINTTLVINAGKTSSINFDFLADKSLHTTGNGSYIFSPVVKTETKSEASVVVNTDSTVDVTGGSVNSANTVGMDLDGSVKLNFEIGRDKEIELNADNSIKINTNSFLK